MRIFRNSFELMSEMGRELNSYGDIVKPKHYQNKNIEGNEEFITKEIICQQYCLTDLGDPIWLFIFNHAKEWADAEFKERVSLDPTTGEPWNPGEAWKLREEVWKQFLVHSKDEEVYPQEFFDYTYSDRIMKDVTYKGRETTKLDAIIQLLREDPDTRKAVLNIFGSDSVGNDDENGYDGKFRIPCSMYYDFLIRESPKGDKQLNITYHERSCDYFTFFGTDVYMAWRLMEYVAKQVGVKPGYLFHSIDSFHAYKKDWHYFNLNLEDLQDKY